MLVTSNIVLGNSMVFVILAQNLHQQVTTRIQETLWSIITSVISPDKSSHLSRGSVGHWVVTISCHQGQDWVNPHLLLTGKIDLKKFTGRQRPGAGRSVSYLYYKPSSKILFTCFLFFISNYQKKFIVQNGIHIPVPGVSTYRLQGPISFVKRPSLGRSQSGKATSRIMRM